MLIGASAVSASGSGISLLQSMDLTGDTGVFSEEYLDSLFGIGTTPSEEWFGPSFENSSSASSFLSEFYVNTTISTTGGFTPVKIDVTHQTPSKIYYYNGKEITYTQYQSTASSSSARNNELWIQKGQDWSQYAIVQEKAGVQLIVFTPSGGQADYFEIHQSDATSITSKSMSISSGYVAIPFTAEKTGRYILLFVLNSQPSNAVIVDVISEAPTLQQYTTSADMPPASNGDNPDGYGQGGAVATGTSVTSSTSGTTSTTITQTQHSTQSYGAANPSQTVSATAGDTPVTIQSQGMKGYQVYVDEAYVGTDGMNGDALDGKFSFKVVGGQSHSIRVFDGQNNYIRNLEFPKGVQKIIKVEPGTTVYV